MEGMLFFWLLKWLWERTINEFSRHGRGKGIIGIQTSERNGQAVGACLVSER